MKILLYILVIVLLFSCKHSKTKNGTSSVADENEFHYRPLTSQEKADYSAAVKKMYDSMLGKHGFNGSILVSKNGEILFEDYHGFSDIHTKDSITPTTPFHLASTSKTFTGMAVMKLYEEKKLNLDDSLQV
ncbi:MAG TPA: serine hydrolase domain-containing protein, partial [Segetibacter sp.]|nr:serine hydrolase domain-containing protein [Segetibacter sp.]